MTKNQWAEMVEWLHAQWPAGQRWEPATVTSTFKLLERHDASDVWSGLFRLHESGSKWMPQPPEIVKEAREVAAEQALLKPPRRAITDGEQPLTLREYLDLRGFDTFDDAVRASIS